MARPSPAHELLVDAPLPSLQLLEEWANQHNVKRSRGLKVDKMEDGGWKLVARRDYLLGEILCQIPKSSLLSMRTSSLPPLIPPSSLQPHSSHTILYLAFALLHEMRLREESAFWGYIQCLPRETILLPAFWPIEELAGEDGRLAKEWISGTDAERDLLRKDTEGLSLDDIRQFYVALAPHLPPTSHHPKPSPFVAYLHTYSLICTRAFQIDLYHTVALCPFADLLNHSSTHSHTSLSVDDFVCHICGSLSPCSHDIASTSGVVKRLEHLPDHERRKLEVSIDTVDLVVDKSPITPGEEVFNCYGESMSDGRLLVEWGFIEDDSTGGPLSFDLSDLEVDDEALVPWYRLVEDDKLRRLTSSLAQHEDRLLGSPREDRPAALDLDQDGVLSINIFALVVLTLIGNIDTASAENMLRTSVQQVEKAWATLSQDDESDAEWTVGGPMFECEPDTVRAVERIVALLDTRLNSLHRADASLEELFDVRDHLPPGAPLQRMAMTLLVNERSLLESTRQKWADLFMALKD